MLVKVVMTEVIHGYEARPKSVTFGGEGVGPEAGNNHKAKSSTGHEKVTLKG